MEFDFDKTRIREQIKSIKRMPHSEAKKYDIRILNHLLGKNNGSIQFKCNGECIDVCNLLLTNFEDLFQDTPEEIDLLKNAEYQDTNISIDETLTIIHDFFKTRKESIYERFLENYDKKSTNLRITPLLDTDKIPGFTYPIETIKESYIYCGYTGTIKDAITLAHEYGHSTMFLYHHNLVRNPNNIIYRELDGVYFENEITDYLIKNNIHTRDAILSSLLEHYYMLKCAELLCYRFDIENLYYLLSYLIAIEITNKDELLEKIVTYNAKSPLDALYFINSHLTLNQHTEEYHQRLIKKAKEYNLQ